MQTNSEITFIKVPHHPKTMMKVETPTTITLSPGTYDISCRCDSFVLDGGSILPTQKRSDGRVSSTVRVKNHATISYKMEETK